MFESIEILSDGDFAEIEDEFKSAMKEALCDLIRSGELFSLIAGEVESAGDGERKPRVGDVVQYCDTDDHLKSHGQKPTISAAIIIGLSSVFGDAGTWDGRGVDLAVFDRRGPPDQGDIHSLGNYGVSIPGRFRRIEGVPYSADFGAEEYKRHGCSNDYHWWRYVGDEEGNILDRLARLSE